MRARVGHIGSALSIVELLCALYGSILRVASPTDAQRDRFVLSKGHAALALYVIFYLKGWDHRETVEFLLRRRHRAGRPSRTPAGRSRFLDGQHGHGTRVRGRRRARRPASGIGPPGLRARERRGMQRGVDLGGRHVREPSSPGRADRVARLQRAAGVRPYPGRARGGQPGGAVARAFGWDVQEVDGHDLRRPGTGAGRPGLSGGESLICFVARTTCGKGVSYMEGLDSKPWRITGR